VAFYEKLVAFAKKHEIMVLHDNAYSDIMMDGQRGISFLSVPGAADVGVEFNSLSKTYNLTGMRVSFVVGNADMVQRFRAFRSQIDYGMFYPAQAGAVAALTGPQDIIRRNQQAYQARRDALCGGLRKIGWEVPDSKGSMFVWAKIPEGYTSSVDFVLELMDRTGIIGVPGLSFGAQGEGYVRFALVVPPERMEEAVRRIADSDILHQ
ncbi:MAG: aminotransferase class I/II-fold pyridoxal phosphate-dependent enzyme, partial [Butyricicoccus pullicaecorum]|nr:aminotransferase class I/II-fold pyridoxal phosphate-dependent enzyme [Butyricicoccus pullicaecorum]